MLKLKNIFATFFLAVFLFPMVQGEMHNFEHINDFHCHASTDHFHQAEHHCVLCDFTNDFSVAPSFQHHDIVLGELAVISFLFSENNLPKHVKDFQSLRAPPSLA